MKSGNINTINTVKDITVDLNVHFFLPCFPEQTDEMLFSHVTLLHHLM